MINAFGVDVSHWQGTINWNLMLSMGVDFAFAKCTDGLGSPTPPDKQYIRNHGEALSRDILFDGYHWWRLDLDPISQARYFCDTLRPGTVAPVVDVEETKFGFPADRVLRLQKLLIEIEKLTGKRPIIYTAAWYWDQYFSGANAWAWQYVIWAAHFKNFAGPYVPKAWAPANYDFWQFTDKLDGKKFGTESAGLDGDTYNGSVQELRTKFAIDGSGSGSEPLMMTDSAAWASTGGDSRSWLEKVAQTAQRIQMALGENYMRN